VVRNPDFVSDWACERDPVFLDVLTQRRICEYIFGSGAFTRHVLIDRPIMYYTELNLPQNSQIFLQICPVWKQFINPYSFRKLLLPRTVERQVSFYETNEYVLECPVKELSKDVIATYYVSNEYTFLALNRIQLGVSCSRRTKYYLFATL